MAFHSAPFHRSTWRKPAKVTEGKAAMISNRTNPSAYKAKFCKFSGISCHCFKYNSFQADASALQIDKSKSSAYPKQKPGESVSLRNHVRPPSLIIHPVH